MHLVICQDSEVLASVASNLRTRSTQPFVGVDNGGLALRLLRLNPIETVLLDARQVSRGWLRELGRHLLGLRCIVLGVDAHELNEMRNFMPQKTTYLPAPVDWDDAAAALDGREIETSADPSGIVAVGLEDILSLVAMAQSNSRIDVTAGVRRGSLYIEDGVVVHAHRGNRSGEDVAYEILSWLDPDVKTKPLDGALIEHTMQLPVPAVLCEAARRNDELMRVPTCAQVQGVFDRLASLQGFTAASMIQVDTGQILVNRGTQAAHLSPDILRATVETAKFWALERMKSGFPARGATFWNEDGVTLLVPLRWQLIVTLVSERTSSLSHLRDSLIDAQRNLLEIMEPRLAGGGASAAANAIPW